MENTVRTGGSPATPNDRGFAPTVWSQVDWKKVERRVQNLRLRIFRAAKEQRGQQVRNLTTLLLRSYANMVVSVRRITQVNRGRHTPGVAGERLTTPDERASWSTTSGSIPLESHPGAARLYPEGQRATPAARYPDDA